MSEKLDLRVSADKKGLGTITEMTRGMRRFDREVNKANTTLGGMTGALRAAVIVTGINQAMSAFRQLSRVVQQVGKHYEEGLQANRIAAQFDTMTAATEGHSAALRASLKDVTNHEIAMTDLEKAAILVERATGDAAHATTVLAFSYRVAAASGEDTIKVAERLSKAMASGRAQSLREYGIFVDQQWESKRAAEALGVSVAMLTEEEKRRTVQLAALAEMEVQAAGYARQTGNVYARTMAQMADARSAMQQWFAGQEKDTRRAIEAAKEWQAVAGAETLEDEMAAYREAILLQQRLTSEHEKATRELKSLEDAYASGQHHLGGQSKSVRELRQEMAAKRKEVTELEQTTRRLGDAGSVAMKAYTEALDESVKRLAKAAEVAGTVELGTVLQIGMEGAERLQAALNVRLEEAARDIEHTQARVKELTDIYGANSDQVITVANNLARLKQGYDEVHQAARKLTEGADLIGTATLRHLEIVKDAIDMSMLMGDQFSENHRQLEQQHDALVKILGPQSELITMYQETSRHAEIARSAGVRYGEAAAGAAAILQRLEQRQAEINKLVGEQKYDEAERQLRIYNAELAAATPRLEALGMSTDALAATQSRLAQFFDTTTTAIRGQAKELELLRRAQAAMDVDPSLLMRGLAPMQMPGVPTIDAAPTDDPSTARRAGPRDMTEQEFNLRMALHETTLSEMEAAEGQHALRVYQIQEQYQGQARALEMATLEEKRRHAEVLSGIEERDQEKKLRQNQEIESRFAQMANKIQEDRQQALVDEGRLNEAKRRQQEILGEISATEAELQRLRIAAADQTLGDTDRKIIQLQIETQETRLATEAQYELAQAYRSVGDSMMGAMSQMEQLAAMSGETFDPRIRHITRSVNQFSHSLGDLIQNSGKTMAEMGPAIAGMTTAIGSAVAGLGMGARKSAAIMAGIATANAIFLAFFNPPAAAAQAAAAVQYAIVAGIGGRRRRGRVETTGTATDAGPRQAAPVHLEINFSGQSLITDRDMHRTIIGAIREASKVGMQIPAAAIGGR